MDKILIPNGVRYREVPLHSRVVFILLRDFRCDNLTASTIQLQHLMQETFIMATKKEYLALTCVGFVVFLICHLDHAVASSNIHSLV